MKVKIEILTGKLGVAIISFVDKEQSFTFSDNLTLHGLKIESVTMSRVTDNNGNVRADCLGLQLKTKRDVKYFKEGQIVELKNEFDVLQ